MQSQSLIARTTDAGETWTMTPVANYVRIVMKDSTFGLAIGSKGPHSDQSYSDVIHRTTDGGETWSEVMSQRNSPPMGLVNGAIADASYGLAVGVGTKVLSTTDGGLTWAPAIDDLPETNQVLAVNAVAFPSRDVAYIATNHGQVFKRTGVSGISASSNGRAALIRSLVVAESGMSLVVEGHGGILVEVYDLIGARRHSIVLRAGVGGKTIFVPTHDLPAGLYVVRVVAGGVTDSRSIVLHP